jgi:hypothetical protein
MSFCLHRRERSAILFVNSIIYVIIAALLSYQCVTHSIAAQFRLFAIGLMINELKVIIIIHNIFIKSKGNRNDVVLLNLHLIWQKT